MAPITTNKPVLVTGATGYIASWIIKKLLEAGLTVKGSVRDISQKDRYAHLEKIAAATPGTFLPFQADLLDAGAFDAAAADCGIISIRHRLSLAPALKTPGSSWLPQRWKAPETSWLPPINRPP